MTKWPTRPTTDIAKEALYNILHNRIEFDGLVALDLFGGTGMHALEMASRGASEVTYVDQYVPAIRWIKSTIKALDISEITILRSEVKKYLLRTEQSFDYIFADPPYALSWLAELPNMIFDNFLLKEDGLMVIEHDQNHNFEQHPAYQEERKYGQSRFSFFKYESSEQDPTGN